MKRYDFSGFFNVHVALIYIVMWCNKEWSIKSQTFQLLIIIYIYIFKLVLELIEYNCRLVAIL